MHCGISAYNYIFYNDIIITQILKYSIFYYTISAQHLMIYDVNAKGLLSLLG